MSRFLSAIILSGSLVVGAFLMRPPRYEGFPVDNEILERLPTISVGEGSQSLIHGVFDRRTGEVCYRIFRGMTEVAPSDEDDARCPLPSD